MKIAFFGDSITAGFEQLKQHKNVWNLGVGGHKSIELIGRFIQLTRLQPDRLFIMIGTNDYLVGKRIWQDYIKIDYGVMIDALFTLCQDNLKDTEVFVLSIPPIRWPEQLDVISSNRDIDQWNTLLQTKTLQYGYRYLDMASLLKSDDNGLDQRYTTDGVHFSSEGYQVFYDLIAPYLDK